MSELYPFRMLPAFDPRPWGTLDLSPVYPNHRFTEKIGEAWLTGDACQVSNGPLAGKSLAELSARYGRELIGAAARDPNRFPLLVKLLFPHEKLSVQVHPDDEAARRVGEPWGKTECWYVAHAKPGAQIALGLRPGVTRDQFAKAIAETKAENLLNWINIYSGEMIYVAAGTVHTLGPGSILVETQQQSDMTYRLYDYGRARELHLEQGLAAVKEQVASGKVIHPAPVELNGSHGRRSQLIEAPYFAVDMFELKSLHEFATSDDSGKSSVQIMLALEGCGILEVAGTEPVTLAKGDAVVVPSSISTFRVRPQWTVELIRAAVPGKPLSEPATRM
jgi:mannose-6-phosphate isomerase